jgi:hypothetical protein
MKGRALRRALATSDAHRISGDVPLIVSTTELITPELAYEMLLKNQSNRPINWKKVEEYAAIMAKGEWALHGQGIVLDTDGNILTGQKRLWAVIYSHTSVYMQISRGNPRSVARLLDRGTPQSARDLAARGTGKKHSPTEASIARGVLASLGEMRPSVDRLATTIESNANLVAMLLGRTSGMKKSRAVLMILSAICAEAPVAAVLVELTKQIGPMAEDLELALHPHTATECWGRGTAFGLALEHARRIVRVRLCHD